jgi:tRNA(fMet)-specific endonuclease VapC
VNYSLDTNACIALINGSPRQVRQRFVEAVSEREASVVVCSVVVFELHYGVAKSARVEANRQRVATFLGGPLSIVEFDADDAAESGEIRAHLERDGTPIGAYDVLIAGQARRRGLTLVTANVAEFARVDGLVWQDWAAA